MDTTDLKILKVYRTGRRSRGIVIPRAILESADFAEDEKVVLEVVPNEDLTTGILIRRLKDILK